jgi:hypothetical protein
MDPDLKKKAEVAFRATQTDYVIQIYIPAAGSPITDVECRFDDPGFSLDSCRHLPDEGWVRLWIRLITPASDFF